MASKKELLEQEVAKAVNAGKAVTLETVDFSDPDRPKTCLEVDFPILRINELAAIEASSGATKKPIYQLSKWWARRQPSVFRSLLLAAATKAPEDPSHAAKLIWDNYYANHQKRGSFSNLKVADIFMGGGTTLVEGSRLGMQMTGNDLNPVAWFVVKQALANVELNEVTRLLADVEAEVKPQLMPYYSCDGPGGEKGKWTHLPSKQILPEDFDPLGIPRHQRCDYSYDGPEIIYVFWAKHGPCQVTGCGHRTPIISSPVVAVKTLSVKYWEHKCVKCGVNFHVEQDSVRLAPDEPLFVVPSQFAYSVLTVSGEVVCPNCGLASLVRLGKSKSKKIDLTLLLHPSWLAGSPKQDKNGEAFGGSVQDALEPSSRWHEERASSIKLLEVHGTLPDEVTCPETGVTFKTGTSEGSITKQGHFICRSCGTVKDQLSSFRATGKTGPTAGYVIQGYSPKSADRGDAYNGRFFARFDKNIARQYNAALKEWDERKEGDLLPYHPSKSKIPLGHEAHQRRPLDQHGYIYWEDFFNTRQLLVHSVLLKAITTVGKYEWAVREYVLGAFQQYLRNNSSFSFWNIQADQLEPQFSNNNFHPKTSPIENNVFGRRGRGNWIACAAGLAEVLEWKSNPWETVSTANLAAAKSEAVSLATGKSEKAWPHDPVMSAKVYQGSSTDLAFLDSGSVDLVITDPPFGDLIQYSELSDFFYVWLRCVLSGHYPTIFGNEYTPKTLEAVSNRYREPEDANGFYQRLLTECWKESYRILKTSGILAFTFHHSEDEPWVAVLESLFDAGFYLEATYPIRSDETKGDGQFGSQKVEYDIIHVCRKRTEEPTAVSWGRMRREVMSDVRQLQSMLENHVKGGLPAADIQVIRRGKALEMRMRIRARRRRRSILSQ